MSKERARKREERERESGIKAAAAGSAQERRDRAHARQAAAGKAGKGNPVKTTAKPSAKDGSKPPKKSGSRTPAGNKRKSAPVGRADGPLARRRRFRVRLLIILLLLVNIAAGVIWRDWKVSLAVFILSVITAPLFAALLLRRRK